MEREWAKKRGKQTKTVNKRHTENSIALIGGDLSTPTYMSAHIFDWMNDCCTFVVHVRCVYFFVGSFLWALCRSFESSDACYNYSQQTQQSKGKKAQPLLFSFGVFCFFIWLTSIYKKDEMGSDWWKWRAVHLFAMKLWARMENCQPNEQQSSNLKKGKWILSSAIVCWKQIVVPCLFWLCFRIEMAKVTTKKGHMHMPI